MVGQQILDLFIGVRIPVGQHFGKLSASYYGISMNWFVYMLLCDQKTLYVGITSDLKQRYQDHLGKKSFHTKRFSELILVYCEKYPDRYRAAEREKQLKGWSRAKKQLLIDGELGKNVCTEFAKVILG